MGGSGSSEQKKRGVGDGDQGGKRSFSPNHESSEHSWVDNAGKRRGGPTDNGDTDDTMEVPSEARVLQEMEEFNDLPELCKSDAATTDDEHDDDSTNGKDTEDDNGTNNIMVELADGTAENDDDSTSVQEGNAADEDEDGPGDAATEEGGVRGGEGGAKPSGERPQELERAVASSYF